MESVEKLIGEGVETSAQSTATFDAIDDSVSIEPDLDFIKSLIGRNGDSYKKCVQCGTCSAVCALSPDTDPFPAKEMAWASWGMKDRLLKDPDVWLCHQCNDCSTRCPRGARPGDVLSAVRRETIIHYAFPRFLARWVARPIFIPVLLGFPAVLLGLLLEYRDQIQNTLGFSGPQSDKIVYSYSSNFPHWALNSFFLFFSVLVTISLIVGIARFWRALKSNDSGGGTPPTPVKSVPASIGATLMKVITHKDFTECTRAHSRLTSHLLAFFGFLALCVVTLWVITSGFNPLIGSEFVYPFNFWNPWKVLANLAGASLVVSCVIMIRDRFRDADIISSGSYSDWWLVWALFLVVLSGFATELLHYLRMEPHRHAVYFVHLVFVFALLMYLPYSKFAHLIYRTTALVFAEHTGRNVENSDE